LVDLGGEDVGEVAESEFDESEELGVGFGIEGVAHAEDGIDGLGREAVEEFLGGGELLGRALGVRESSPRFQAGV